MVKNIHDRLKGCLVLGAVGDALGSYHESKSMHRPFSFDHISGITDDTQLTLATCESIFEQQKVSPSDIAQSFLKWYNQHRLVGLGSSTLKALRDLQVGAHWALSGRTGEYAAGNGAAMRIAPLAFFLDVPNQRTMIRDVCFITHKNDEAYVGALSILYAIHSIICGSWREGADLISLITSEIPDTLVRDNLLKLQENSSLTITKAAKLIGCSGHVAESVPLAIFSSQKIRETDPQKIIGELINCGGDTDTNASMAGHIMGSYLGYSNIPEEIGSLFNRIEEKDYILDLSEKLSGIAPIQRGAKP
ncbi:MAG TPA: ADP-ribosylglycohydrolase family protein [Puia sp.]|uniref:ADP-ribosylglycohydrolase family protein n=1 Tax=Puia sp. TaxID=2045100 RepID=UPI002BD32A3C|nr:ADP-ribosylglycohydrolase family protein [Puia sp.]HVU96161.1 ADP-ribosylglycohydrolase family protein [Puia sp.]